MSFLAVIPLLGTIIDKIFPNAEDAAKAKLELAKIEADLQTQQIEVNKEEAKHSSIFVAGARPMIMWICAAIFAYTYLIQPFIALILAAFSIQHLPFPKVDTGEIMPVLIGLLGLGGYRTYEKVKGVAK